jgi:hypothetical protein
VTSTAGVLEILMRRGPVPVPHPLFYLVSMTLPYHWRTGFLFVPLLLLLSGSAGRALDPIGLPRLTTITDPVKTGGDRRRHTRTIAAVRPALGLLSTVILQLV